MMMRCGFAASFSHLHYEKRAESGEKISRNNMHHRALRDAREKIFCRTIYEKKQKQKQ